MDDICLCFHVPQRKIVAFMRRTKPCVASQLSDCLGAGTGCHWCVPYLEEMFARWQAGLDPTLEIDPAAYANDRAAYRRDRRRRAGSPGSEAEPDPTA